MSLQALPVSVADMLQLQQGIEFFTDTAAATTEAAAINAGTQTVAQYANQLILNNQVLSQIVMAADSLMFGAVDTEKEMTTLTTQFLPAQLAFFNSLPPATQTGAGGPIVWDAEVTGFALSGPNGDNNPVTKGNFAANFASLNTGANAGDAGNMAFAEAVSTAVFGNLNETNQVLSFLTSFISFFTANPSALNGASLLQGADGITFGAEVGIALANPTTVGAFLEGLVSNTLIDNAEGILIPGVALGLQPLPTPLQTTYTFTTVDDPLAGIHPKTGLGDTGLGTSAESINNAGQIVGTYMDNNDLQHGFLYSNATFTALTDPLASIGAGFVFGTYAVSSNASGQIIGSYYDANETTHSFLYNNGTFTDLTDPLARSGVGSGTFAESINTSGQIVGFYRDSGGIQHGFLYDNGIFTTLTDPSSGFGTFADSINASGQIIGYYNDANIIPHGFLYNNGTFTTLTDPLAAPSGGGTLPMSINASGQIAGNYYDASGAEHGFFYSNGTYTDLTDPSAGVSTGLGTVVSSINASGQVVGHYTESSGVEHGFLYSNGAYTDINDPSAGGGSGQGTIAISINDAGEIVGSYVDSSGNSHGFLATPSQANVEGAAQGTAIYSASLSSHPTAAPFPGAATASIATTASHVEVTGVVTHFDHTGM